LSGAPAPGLATADALLAAGDLAAVRRLLTSIAEHEDAQATGALVRLARLAAGERHDEEARRLFEQVLARDIEDDEAWRFLEGTRPTTASEEPAPGSAAPTLGTSEGASLTRYRLSKELGRGSFAAVYLADDLRLGRPVALKLLHAAGPRLSSVRRSLVNEAAVVSRLRHPGVVAIFDVDEAAGLVAMEHLDGGSLRDRLRGAPGRALPPAEVGRVLHGLLETLAHVHSLGLVHGDLSPRNILFRRGGRPVLVDFVGQIPAGGDELARPMGTPLYLAPERWAGEDASAGSDLFAVGAVCWEALTGLPPRRAEEARLATKSSDVRLPDSARGPAALAQVIEALVAADPQTREAAAAAMLRG
jgi:serine/threonine-protein kinase